MQNQKTKILITSMVIIKKIIIILRKLNYVPNKTYTKSHVTIDGNIHSTSCQFKLNVINYHV